MSEVGIYVSFFNFMTLIFIIPTDIAFSSVQLSNYKYESDQMVKNPPAMQETWVRSLGWEDLWRKAWQPTHSYLENPHGQRSLWSCSPWGCKGSDMNE